MYWIYHTWGVKGSEMPRKWGLFVILELGFSYSLSHLNPLGQLLTPCFVPTTLKSVQKQEKKTKSLEYEKCLETGKITKSFDKQQITLSTKSVYLYSRFLDEHQMTSDGK